MDNRLITNVKAYDFKLLQELLPVIYTLKNNGKQGIGVVAQDVEKIAPELLRVSANGVLDVDYQKLSVLLLAVVKELDLRVKALEQKPKQTRKKKA